MNQNDDLDPKLLVRLEGLRATPARDPQRAARTRAAFLAEAELLAKTAPVAKPAPFAGWKHLFASLRLTSPLKFAVVALLVVGVILGSGTLTVAAAQNSLPNENLYPIKTWSEDLRLGLATDNTAQLTLDLEFTNRRMTEIQEMLQTDAIPPETVLNRLENQIENALEVSANLPDDARATTALLQVGDQLQAHQQSLRQLQLKTGTPAVKEIQNRVQALLELNLRLAKAGADQPAWLREQFRLRQQQNRPWQTTVVTATPEIIVTPTPGNGQGYGKTQTPQKTGSVTPGTPNGYGPGGPQGPSVTGTPSPETGNGPGGPQHNTPSKPGNTPSGPGKPEKTPSGPGNGNGSIQNTPSNPDNGNGGAQSTPSVPVGGTPQNTPSGPNNGPNPQQTQTQSPNNGDNKP